MEEYYTMISFPMEQVPFFGHVVAFSFIKLEKYPSLSFERYLNNHIEHSDMAPFPNWMLYTYALL